MQRKYTEMKEYKHLMINIHENNCIKEAEKKSNETFIPKYFDAFIHKLMNEVDDYFYRVGIVANNHPTKDDAYEAILNKLLNIPLSLAIQHARQYKSTYTYDEFKKFITYYSYSLKDMNYFINDLCQPSRDEIIENLSAIKALVNGYTDDNKKNISAKANQALDDLINQFNISNLGINDTIDGLYTIVHNMEADKEIYYNGLTFFSSMRRDNSNLNPIIIQLKKKCDDLSILTKYKPAAGSPEMRWY